MKFLLIQRRSLGDALYTALVGEVIKREIPNAVVDFLTLPFAVDFFNSYRFIDRAFPDKGVLGNIKSIFGKYDVILDYEATFRTYPLVLLSLAKERIAFYRKKRERFLYPIYNKLIPYEYLGFTFWDRLKLLEPLGVDVNKYISKRYLPTFSFKNGLNQTSYSTIYGNYIVFSPKGVIPTKEVKPNKVKEIVEKIKESFGLKTVIAVEPRERAYISQLKRLGLEVFSKSLIDFTFLLKEAKALISIESFPYHLALLLRVPSVVIVQGYDIWFKERFGLIEEYRPPLDCVPCWEKSYCPRGDFACTERIEVDAILEKLKKFIKR